VPLALHHSRESGERFSRMVSTRGQGPVPVSGGWEREVQKGDRSMRQWLDSVQNFLQSEEGPTAVEYAVMFALIIVVCIAAITTLGSNASSTFNKVATTVGSAS